ncbi:hypothetical protein FHX81_0658 [Saccharothrix saharensis]|uniref:Protein kinase domain-containing protein n=1 Tax=Saccharothrix saharensis TaxID=571190 RepID=A0A543J6H3_9PSEU|nr:hypothetical protein [Saccharothrix saharensis]TQM78392.1 hypothetical protein FHX81_0658 [Saccharothrix saharensis]
MTRYPTPDEYMKAVQRPDCFVADELRGLELVAHPLYGVPMPAAGTSAVVFKAVADGEPQALRFFTRDDVSSSERYGALHEHFTSHGLENVVALPRWVDGGVRVNGRSWPVVRMQWVEGHTLNRHVDELVERRDTASLAALAVTWRDLVARIQRAEFAHGDLQHGNVLVSRDGDLRLVDFDCSWIARLSGALAPGETGHRNYQPEQRPWGRWMDTFSGLVIYLSLLALARDPTGWRTCYTGENLLLRREDFRPPFDTPAWAHLAVIGDPHVTEVAGRLKQCCTPGWVASSGLDDLLAPRFTPWWERTPVVVEPVPVPAPRPPVARPVVTREGNWWAAAEPSAPTAPVEQPARERPVPAGVLVVAAFVALLVFGLLADSEAGAALGVVVAALVASTVWWVRRRGAG